MSIKVCVVRSLPYAYPAIWRTEYGAELEALLLSRRLTAMVVIDVIKGAAEQRIRNEEPWKLCGSLLFAWTSVGIFWNLVRAFSPLEYSCFSDSVILVLFAGAFWTTARGRAKIRAAAIGTAKAALVGAMPEVLVALLVALGALHPHSVLLYTQESAPLSPIRMLFGEILGSNLVGLVIGGTGGTLGWLARYAKPVPRKP